MQMSIADILTDSELVELRSSLAESRFVDGRETAGWSAALVKLNEQAADDISIERQATDIVTKLQNHIIFRIAAYPKRFIKTVFSRYRPGMAYGSHVDNGIMDGERTDISFTLFLSDPETYDGGELILETASGDEMIKLPAGSLFTYPSTTLHRVAEVRHGERLALVGWVRSYIRDASKRELLFDLETARRLLFDREGKTPEFDLLSKSSANLLRMWVDD